MSQDKKTDIVDVLIVASIIAVVIIAMMYSSLYVLDRDGKTATNGIIFKSTINLSEYRPIGTGTRLVCPSGGVLYTRSAVNEATFVCNK